MKLKERRASALAVKGGFKYTSHIRTWFIDPSARNVKRRREKERERESEGGGGGGCGRSIPEPGCASERN
jgi:hypothetical protein